MRPHDFRAWSAVLPAKQTARPRMLAGHAALSWFPDASGRHSPAAWHGNLPASAAGRPSTPLVRPAPAFSWVARAGAVPAPLPKDGIAHRQRRPRPVARPAGARRRPGHRTTPGDEIGVGSAIAFPARLPSPSPWPRGRGEGCGVAGEGLAWQQGPHRPPFSVAITVPGRSSAPGQCWPKRRLNCPLSRPSTSPSPSKSKYHR
jgi:hypothetical protein